MAQRAAMIGFDDLRVENSVLWKDLWEFEERVRREQPACPGNPASLEAPGFAAVAMSAAAAFFGDRDGARAIFHAAW